MVAVIAVAPTEHSDGAELRRHSTRAPRDPTCHTMVTNLTNS